MLNGLFKPCILGTAPGQGDPVRDPGLLCHDKASLSHGQLNPRSNLIPGLSLTHQCDHFTLRKYCALGSDGNDIFGA